MGIHTLRELEPQVGDPRLMVERVEAVTRELIQQGKLVVLLGGEHLLSAGTAKAHAEANNGLTVLQFDAHADLRDEYMGTRYSHACTARRMLESAPLVQVGIRSLSSDEHAFLQQRPDITTFYDGDGPWDDARIDRLVESLGPKVFVSLDLDVLDPAIMTAVGTAEPGGLSWYEMLKIMRAVSRRRTIVGLDVVELCPPEGPTASAYTAAKLTYKLIGYATHPWE
ncbi:MAG: agmatinase [Chloroflexi bacterium]|nr:agmatinase [Chloroflexota bacterium]